MVLTRYNIISILALIFSWVSFTNAQSFNPVAWPSESAWRAYTIKDTTINDPALNDPSTGGTTPQGIVNISSGIPDRSLPSIYYASDGSVIFVRFRIEGDPNTYKPGATVTNGDPWKSALWTMLLDLNGDGWRDFGLILDGSSGSPSTPIDRIRVVYSRLKTTQSNDYSAVGTYLLGEIFACQAYTSGPYTGMLKEYDGNGNLVTPPWTNPNTTIFDFGTSRTINRTSTNGDYLLDFQIPISLLNAAAYNGPTVTTSTIFTATFTTSNSLTNPFQKDYAYLGAFCPSVSAPVATGDPITPQIQLLPKLIVTSVTTTFCPIATLETTILTSQQVLDCPTVVSSVVTTNFYYWYDRNSNLQLDEPDGSWVLIGTAVPTSLGVWAMSWNSSSLPRGQYIIKVVATDLAGNTADSYEQTLPQYPNIFAVYNNNCGILPASLSKTVNKSIISASETEENRTLTYTITVSNPQSQSITLDTLIDQLPPSFSFISNATGGTLTPTTSPIAGSTGLIRWIFTPAATIPPGESRTLNFNVLGGTTAGTFANSVFAKGSTYFTSAINVAPVVVTNACAVISKSTSTQAGLTQGQYYSYFLTYQNTGTIPLTNVIIVDSLEQGITIFVSASSGGTFDPATSKVTWSIGTIAPGVIRTDTIVIGLSNPYSGTNPLVNKAVLTAAELPAPVISNTVTNLVLGAVLNLTKSASPVYAYPENNITYSITYSNVGTETANNVIIRDTLPSTLTYVTGTAEPFTPSVTSTGSPPRQVLTFNVGNLNAGEMNKVITFQAIVANPYPTIGENQPVINKAVISSNNTGPYYVTTPIYVTAIPNVTLKKTTDKPVYPSNDSATITLTLKNNGYFNAQLDSLVDIMPQNFIFGRTSGGTLSPTTSPAAGSTGSIKWTFSPAASIAPGETRTLLFRVRLPLAGLSYTNVARASGILVSAAKSTITDSITITIAENSEAINKSVNTYSAFEGDTLIYTIYYLNGTSSYYWGRNIRDTLPSTLTFVSQTNTNSAGGTVTFTRSGQVLNWSIGTNPPNNSLTITLRARINTSPTTVTNRAYILSSPQVSSNIVATAVDAPPAITFTKSVNLTSAPVNTELIYTINYSNAPGVAASTNAVIVDTIPSQMTFVYGSVTGGGTFYTTPTPKGRIVWNLGTVAANSSGSVSFRATIDNGTPINTVITNTARYSDNEGTRKSSSVRDTVRALPHFTFTKSVNRLSAGPGDTLTYTINYKNSGTSSASSVTIVDTIPANTIFVSATGGGTLSGSRVIWAIGTVDVNDSGSVILRVRIPKPLAINSISTITNRATISASGIPDKSTPNVNTAVVYPHLVIIKSVDSTLAHSKSILTYTLSISNSTIIPATETTVFDSIPLKTTYIPGSTKVNNAAVNDVGGTSPLVDGLNIGTVTFVTPVTITFQVRINSPIKNGDIVSNSARVTTDKLTNIIFSNTVQTSVISYPKIMLRKTAEAADSIPGSVITYTIKYGNIGTDTLYNFNILDTIPTNTSYVVGSLSGEGASFDAVDNAIKVNKSIIVPDDTMNIVSFQAKVVPTLRAGITTIRNMAYATAANAAGTADSNLLDITAHSVLEISKTAPNLRLLLGDPVPVDTFLYTITYSLTGNAIIDSVKIIDTLASGLTYLESTLNSQIAGTYIDSIVYWEIDSLLPGTIGTATIKVLTTTPGTYHNRSRILCKQDTTGKLTQTTITIVSFPHTGALIQTDTIYPGEGIYITLDDADLRGRGSVLVTTKNLRTSETENIELIETHHNSGIFTYLLSTFFDSLANSDNDGHLAVQAGDTIQTTYNDEHMANGLPGTITAITRVVGGYTAAITAEPPLLAAGNSITFTITDLDLNRNSNSIETYDYYAISTTGEKENLTFTETTANSGIFTATIPTYYGITPGTDNNQIFTVQPGDTISVTYYDSLTAIGSWQIISAFAVIGYVDFVTSGKSYIDLNGAPARPPDTLAYTITVRNTGNSTATSVAVTDTLPLGVTVVPYSISGGGTLSGRVITFEPFDLPMNDSLILNYRVTIDSSIQNNAAAINKARISANGISFLLSASFTPLNIPVMTMYKEVNHAHAKPGDTLTYTINYSNIGTASATLVTITDPMPMYTTYVPQSVTINGIPKTDESDGDEVTLNGDTIQINAGIVNPGMSGIIKFKVTIN